MQSFRSILFALVAGIAGVGVAFAGEGVEIRVNDASGPAGSSVMVTYDYSAEDSSDVGGFQFSLQYDPAALTPTDITSCGDNAPPTHSSICSEPGGAANGSVAVLIADFSPPTEEILPVNQLSFGSITFLINQPGEHTLTFTSATASDVNAANVEISGNDATVTGTGLASGIEIRVNDASGPVGSSVVVTYDYDAADPSDVGGLQFSLLYDPATLTPTDITTCGDNAPLTHSPICSEPSGAGNGSVSILIADFSPPTDEIMPVRRLLFGSITFLINQPGNHALTFASATASDVNATNVEISGTDATVTGVAAPGFIFADGFELGDLTRWSIAVP